MLKEEKLQQERSLLLTDAYRIFFDANDYSKDILIGYCRLAREILGDEVNNMSCDLVLNQLIKACQAFRPNTQTVLIYRFGLNGEQPISYSDIGKRIYCSTNTANSLCKHAICKLRDPSLAKQYNIKVRKHFLSSQKVIHTHTHISVLKLSTKAHNALLREGIFTVESFLRLSERTLRSIKGVGDKIVSEMLEKQKEFKSQTYSIN